MTKILNLLLVLTVLLLPIFRIIISEMIFVENVHRQLRTAESFTERWKRRIALFFRLLWSTILTIFKR